MQPWVELKEHRGHKRLFVDGHPFVSLGIQIDFLNCAKIEDFDYLFPHLVTMNLNTVFFPLYWSVAEPEEGSFDFKVIVHVLKRAREHGLKISFLWFGSNQGGGFRSAPEWVKADRRRFCRVMDEEGNEQEKLCPECGETLNSEKRALEAFLACLAREDTDHRAIFLQVENEPCLEMNARKNLPGSLMDPYSFRCHCPVCDQKFLKAKENEWDFSARSLAGYFSRLLSNQKKLYPLLTYVNFLLNPQRPGEDLDIYLNECPELDIVAVDYYGFGSNDLAFSMRFFERGRNVNFIAEHSTESVGDAAGNVFRAICEFGAVAFDPWAVDHSFGWRAWRDKVSEKPFVSKDGAWSLAATAYGQSLKALNSAVTQIASAARTGDLLYFAAENLQPRSLEERRWGMVWRLMAGPQGRWALIRTAEGDFTLLGAGLQAVVEPLKLAQSWSVEAGYWKQDQWIKAGEAKVLRESPSSKLFDLEDAQCLRIRMTNLI